MSQQSGYAVVKVGGRQVTVSAGDTLAIDSVAGEPGTELTFDTVLAVKASADAALKVGTPTVAGAKVIARIVEQRKAPKVVVFKKRRRKGFMRKTGHRQLETRVRIESIGA